MPMYRRAWTGSARHVGNAPDRIRHGTVRYGASERSLWSVKSDKLIFAIAERPHSACDANVLMRCLWTKPHSVRSAVALFRKDMKHLVMSGDPDQLPGMLQARLQELHYDTI